MKKSIILLFTLFLLVSVHSKAQMDSWSNKVTWSFSVERIDDSHAYIVCKAKLLYGWHIFSVNHDPNKADLTGYPTTFKFITNPAKYKLIGKLQDASKPHKHVDDLGESLYFEKVGVFKQKVEILEKGDIDVKFEYSFQVCDENGCLFPPDQNGKVTFKGYKTEEAAVNDAVDKKDLKINGDFGKDSKGKDFVKFKNEWIAVPEGNSPKFYKKYLELGGSYAK